MPSEADHRRDRYDAKGNVEAQFVDAAGTVLHNNQGITDLARLQMAEEETLAHAYRDLLAEVRTGTPMTCELPRHVHGRIFGQLCDWAGRWRTVWISKPGTVWPAPDFLEQNMQAFERDVLQKYPAAALRSDAAFCEAVGEIQGEFSVIHPFREGNARTIKLATNLLAAQTGRPLLVYDPSDEGQRQYTDAAKAAFKRKYSLWPRSFARRSAGRGPLRSSLWSRWRVSAENGGSPSIAYVSGALCC